MNLSLIIFYVFVVYKVNGINFSNNACKGYFHYLISSFSPQCYHNPDIGSDIETILINNNYRDFKKYELTTEDGYILNLYRLRPKLDSDPVLLLHGLGANNKVFVSNGNMSLAYIFEDDMDDDVWLGTFRGSINARKHRNLTISDSQFWDFTMDELAEYDLSAQVKFIVNKTNSKIKIVAHSQAATISLMNVFSNSTNNIARHIEEAILLSPLVHMENSARLQLIAKFLPVINIYNRFSKVLFYSENWIHEFNKNLCKTIPHICKWFIELLFGNLSKEFQPESLLSVYDIFPGSMSIKQIIHLLQIVKSGNLQKFDYGEEKNLETYKQKSPPVYNLNNVPFELKVHSLKNDTLSNEQDVAKLSRKLNVTPKEENGNHIEYFYDNSGMIF